MLLPIVLKRYPDLTDLDKENSVTQRDQGISWVGQVKRFFFVNIFFKNMCKISYNSVRLGRLLCNNVENMGWVLCYI